MGEWIYNRAKGIVEENGRFICDPRTDLYGEQIARDHNASVCSPPERWEDVTKKCEVNDYINKIGEFWSIIHESRGLNVMSKANEGYRLRKVRCAIEHPKGTPFAMEQWAFIVERKVTGKED